MLTLVCAVMPNLTRVSIIGVSREYDWYGEAVPIVRTGNAFPRRYCSSSYALIIWAANPQQG